jgi:hypothetical protein
MSDPLGFPVLAGSAITQAFGFLYGRLAVLLDRRRTGQSEIENGDNELGDQGDSDVSWKPDDAALEEYRPSLETLAAALEVYDKHPEIINGEDEHLRRNLGVLWTALEAIYHQQIPLPVEVQNPSGVKITQEADEVTGRRTGLIAGEVSHDARVDIHQKAKHVREGAKDIGARIKRIE